MESAQDISILIRVFSRIDALERQLKSIRHLNVNVPIVVGDDSLDARKNAAGILRRYADLNITYKTLTYDIGLSEGRNILVKLIRTPYFLLCDDDFVFPYRFNFFQVQKLLENSYYDIIGGAIFDAIGVRACPLNKVFQFIQLVQLNTKMISRKAYIGNIEERMNEVTILMEKAPKGPDLVATDIIRNFFVARTETINKIAWNPNLKLCEHEEFFIRAKRKKISVAYSNSFYIYHFPRSLGVYAIFRRRNYYAIALRDLKIRKLSIERKYGGISQKYWLDNNDKFYCMTLYKSKIKKNMAKYIFKASIS